MILITNYYTWSDILGPGRPLVTAALLIREQFPLLEYAKLYFQHAGNSHNNKLSCMSHQPTDQRSTNITTPEHACIPRIPLWRAFLGWGQGREISSPIFRVRPLWVGPWSSLVPGLTMIRGMFIVFVAQYALWCTLSYIYLCVLVPLFVSRMHVWAMDGCLFVLLGF